MIVYETVGMFQQRFCQSCSFIHNLGETTVLTAARGRLVNSLNKLKPLKSQLKLFPSNTKSGRGVHRITVQEPGQGQR